jgi:uncharacterized membrane protein SirB2
MASIGDSLFALTEWIRTTPIVEVSLWVSEQPLCLWLQENFFAIPAFQTLHILSIAILFGSVLMINMRVLGLAGLSRSMSQTLARYQPWLRGGLLALIMTGITLLISEPVRNGVNPIFWIKMLLLLAAVLTSLWFHGRVRARLAQWNDSAGASGALRLGAFLTIILWCAVMAGGRWIAYAPV